MESLEHKLPLTQDLAIAEPELLFEAEQGHEIVAHQFVDLDNDSVKELVVAQNRTDSIVGRITLLTQNDAGRFQPVSERAVGEVFGLDVVDIDGDEQPEVILHHNGELRRVNVHTAEGTLQLGEPTNHFQSDWLTESDWQLVDLNGDGIDDVTMSVFWSDGFDPKQGTVVQLANGDGTFQQEVRYEFDQIIDLNGDSLPDAVKLWPKFSAVLNDGSGTFDAPPTFIDIAASELLAHDLNSDSFTDLIYVDNNGLSIRNGSGDGTLAAPELVLAATKGWDGVDGNMSNLSFNDIDGDGDLDIYIGSELIYSQDVGPHLLVNEAGKFAPMLTASSWALPSPVDVFGDARAEFVYDTPTEISVNSQITPRSIRKQTLDLPNQTFRVMDATNDGVDDIVMVVDRGLAVVQRDDSGLFRETIVDLDYQSTNVLRLNQLVEGDDTNLAVFEDLSGDSRLLGKLHIVRFQNDQWNVEEMELGELAGFSDQSGFPIISDGLKLADLNNDSIDDLILGRPGLVVAYVSSESGWQPTEVMSIESPTIGEVVDIDGDGRLDLVIEGRGPILVTNSVRVALNRGEEWLLTDPVMFEERRAIVTLLDVNNDGSLDLLNRGIAGGGLEVALVMPDGSVDLWPIPPTDSPWNQLMADFNGDELKDFLFGSANGTFVLSFDIQSREWRTSTLPESASSNHGYNIEDYDSDGDFDLVFDDCIYPTRYGEPCSIIAYVNDGSGQFVRETIAEGIEVPDHNGSVDIDADGKTEIVVLDERLAVYQFGKEGWSLASETQSHPGFNDTEITRLELADANQDGIADLVVTQEGSHRQYFLSYGRGDLQFSPLIQVPGDRFSSDGLVYAEHGGALSSWSVSGGQWDWESVPVNVDGFNDQSTFVDLDNDGDQDFVIPSRQGVTIIYQVERGDFDDDGEPTAADLELLCANLGLRTPSAINNYDLNHDYVVDQLDIDFWIAHAAETLRGDANLDGTVNFPDFLALAENFGIVDDDLRWGDGDFNGDGIVNFIDFLALAKNFNASQ